MIGCLINWLKNVRLWWRMKRQWTQVRMSLPNVVAIGSGHGNKVLIIPCDPWNVVGSRGDQAMILAVKQHCGSARIDILTDSHYTDDVCREIGLNPVAEWNVPFDMWMKTNAVRYEKVYILGADVTDGVYGWPTAMKLLMFYDSFSRLGVETHYLGFSWSRTPSGWMRFVLSCLKKELPLPVRDPVSYSRLERFTRHRPLVQVADAAFMLRPNQTPRARMWMDWCDARRKAGRMVVALNIHQMFNDVETKSLDWEDAFARVMNDVLMELPGVTYLLVAHDSRPKVSDSKILARLNLLLKSSTLIDCVMNADEIKAVLGECDALIAGRMHISIAALGQGVPVFGLVYQGKFEGLWRHFGLSYFTLLNPSAFLVEPLNATHRIVGFLSNLSELKSQIIERLPSVVQLSKMNFE